MSDADPDLENACFALVSEQRHERSLLRMLSRPAGTWHMVCALTGDKKAERAVATWLVDPEGEVGYAFVVLFDPETRWTASAHVNVERPQS